MIEHILYKKGYKYQLYADYSVYVGHYIKLEKEISTEYLKLKTDGWLYIRRGYSWDGASGPTFDTPATLRGSLVHDALYQLIRLELLHIQYRYAADCLLKEICIEDGMNEIRAELWFLAVRNLAFLAATRFSEPAVLCAPKIKEIK